MSSEQQVTTDKDKAGALLLLLRDVPVPFGRLRVWSDVRDWLRAIESGGLVVVSPVEQPRRATVRPDDLSGRQEPRRVPTPSVLGGDDPRGLRVPTAHVPEQGDG